MNIPSDMCSHHYFLLTQAEVKPIGLNLGFEPINYELSSKLFLFRNYLRYFIIVIWSSLYTTPRLLLAGISTSSPAGLRQGTNQGDRNKEQRWQGGSSHMRRSCRPTTTMQSLKVMSQDLLWISETTGCLKCHLCDLFPIHTHLWH